MKFLIPFAASLALGLAAPAFAQDQQAAPTAAPSDASSDAPAPGSSDQNPRHRHRHQAAGPYSAAAMALTGDDAKTAAYQASDRQKTYPAVDHGHVPGDPPIIDHSDDRAPVANPTLTSITVPPGSENH